MNPKEDVKLRMLDVLFEVYEKTKSDYVNLSLSKICYKNNVKNSSAVKIIKKELVDCLGTKRTPKYKWKTIRPNIKMAERVYEESMRDQFEIYTKYKKRKLKSKYINNQNDLFTQKDNKANIDISVQERKILNVLLDLYRLTKDNYIAIDIRSFRNEYKLGSYYSGIIIREVFDVKKYYNENDRYVNHYKWKTKKPDLNLVKKICEEARILIAKANKKSIQNGIEVKKNVNRDKNKTISIFWGLIKININK